MIIYRSAGNDNIYRLTNQRAYTLRFDLEDFSNEKWYADYSRFYIANEDDKYRLYLLGYTGNAGMSPHQYSETMTNETTSVNNMCLLKYSSDLKSKI